MVIEHMDRVKSTFSIKNLENLSGIKAHTLRIWEKRYNLLVCFDTNSNMQQIIMVRFVTSSLIQHIIMICLSQPEKRNK